MEIFGQEFTKSTRVGRQLAEKNMEMEKIRGAKILLVEDNLTNQRVATELLENAGFIITIANNGREAVQKVNETAFDAVLMDVQMPVMDGYAAMREIRNMKSESRNIPIIAMTAHAMASEREKCLKAGMNDHATKPIDPESLFAILTRWIKPGMREVAVPQQEDLKEEDMEELPESLPGIDIKSSLIRLGGKKGLSRKLLLMFEDYHNNAAIEIRKALNAGKLDSARRVAHTIKGVSGNIGAMELSNAAGKIEYAIEKGQRKDFSGLLYKFEKSLNQVCESAKLLKKTSSKEKRAKDKTTELDLEKVKPLLINLAGLIDENSLEVDDCFENLKKHLDGAGFREEIKKLQEAIDALDFENARSNLSEIGQALDISLEGGER